MLLTYADLTTGREPIGPLYAWAWTSLHKPIPISSSLVRHPRFARAGSRPAPRPQRAQSGVLSNGASCFSRALLLIISYVYFSQKNPTDKI